MGIYLKIVEKLYNKKSQLLAEIVTSSPRPKNLFAFLLCSVSKSHIEKY